MKAEKAIKRLQRVEALLGTVIDRFDSGNTEVNNLLNAAKSSVVSATQALVASPANTPPAKPEKSATRRSSTATQKRLPAAAKKRGADTKREDMSTPAKSTRKRHAVRSAAVAS